jgi:hypothetical protein
MERLVAKSEPDVDARAGAEQDAVLVDDEDLAVGGDAAEDLREAAAHVPEQADAGAAVRPG